jgi:hypothetical protein
MRSLVDMDTIQIEITNACHQSCSNCTRFCGHHEHPFFMKPEEFDKALASMEGYPRMIGMMGGEPLLHPFFEQYCKKMREMFPKNQLGLWSSFPNGFERYGPLIAETFGHVFPNDHARPDIYHQPLLVGAKEVMVHDYEAYYLIDKCWVQNAWSASINPNGAFFCEIAAAWSTLVNGTGWAVEPGWWWRTPKDFTEQIETYCLRCGGAMPLQRRASIEGIDDISPENFELLKDKSRKIKMGRYKIHNCETIPEKQQFPMAAYKDEQFRDNIVRRYGLYLVQNEMGFMSPFLRRGGYKKPESIFHIARREFAAEMNK